MITRVETEVAGRPLSIETGKLAKQAEGSVLIRYGNTVILSTSVSADKARPDAGFFPLSVDIEERFYAAGKIKGSRFVKREGRPSDWAVLMCRLTDRPLRPLFPKESRNEVQIVNTVLSVDFVNEPETLAIIGASAALSISRAPFAGPVSAVTVGYLDGSLRINPTYEELKTSALNLTVAGTKFGITMVEAGANEVTEELMAEALQMAHDEIRKICALQEELVAKLSVQKKTFTQQLLPDSKAAEIAGRFEQEIFRRLDEHAGVGGPEADVQSKNLFDNLYDEVLELTDEETSDGLLKQGLFELVSKCIRSRILENKQRPDGRGLSDVRPIECEVGLLETNHGSALFTRGGTQALTMTTLGSASDAMIVDSSHLEEEFKKRYLHFYNAPPYSVGEAGRMFGPKRREIGHGALAERALEPVLPNAEDFPYTMLLVSEVLGQNGSSSMASVCGSTLSLMDAGVPIRKPVAGIAMGLVWESDNQYAVLSDIQGMEDFCGDMDFKVAGTADGITALQMDIKIDSIKPSLMLEALNQARAGRLHILGKMKEAISEPRPEVSRYAPRIVSLRIKIEKIRDLIGSGGRTINGIVDKTGVKIDIEDDGLVMVSGNNPEKMAEALEIIKGVTSDPEVGKIYQGKVTRIMDFGAFVEILPGKEGLVHISQLAAFRVNQVEDIVKLGEIIPVKLMEIDSQGRLNLSKKAADPQPPQEA